MPARRQSRALGRTVRASDESLRVVSGANSGGEAVGIKRWRRQGRPRLLRSAVAATDCIPWSPALLELLLEEMYVGDGVEALLGRALRELPKRQYPRAVAVALILRHSWQAEDLDFILKRLGVNGPRVGPSEGHDCD